MSRKLITGMLIALAVVALGGYVVWDTMPERSAGAPINNVEQSAGETRVGLKDFAYDGFALRHPGNFRVETGEDLGGGGWITPSLAKLSFPENAYEDEAETNFNDAFIVISVSDAADAAALCNSLADLPENIEAVPHTVTVNGIMYRSRITVGVGAGNRYDGEIYRTMHEGKCYEIALTVHTSNIGNYPEGTVTEFDKERAFTMLRDVLGTFAFTD